MLLYIATTINRCVTDCQNGGSYISGDHKCRCLPGYMGPDCRQIICANGGKPNTWGNACDCTAQYGGPTCSGESLTSEKIDWRLD